MQPDQQPRASARTLRRVTSGVGLLLSGLLALAGRDAAAIATSKVFLNGRVTPVHFSDGDSFRVLAGPLAGTSARMGGYNTLESFGPVHQWGGWTAKELYFNAKMATINARRGVWHCTSDLSRDGYGRILWNCPDLAESQIRQGFGHAMTVTSAPSEAYLLRAQRKAQQERRGIWAHGIPDYIMTSNHSNDEGYDGKTYNRLVSTRDGHSKKWYHSDIYKECENVCSKTTRYDEAKLQDAVVALRQDATLATFIGRYSDGQLRGLLRTALVPEPLGGLLDEEHRKPLKTAIAAMRDAGALGTAQQVVDSCMIYVAFKRRYGRGSAACLH